MTIDTLNPSPMQFTAVSDAVAREHLPLGMKQVVRLLQKIQHGSLCLGFPDGRAAVFGHGTPSVTLTLHNWNIAAAVLKSGDIGFAESFINGDWHTDDLPGLIALLLRNRSSIESMIYGSWWGSLVYRIRHLLNRNSKSGSRKNIHAHYDIGNAFYALWLDATMTYSSALYRENAPAGLAEAQRAKYRRIIDELHLSPGARVLEIGCGWGGFSEIAAVEANAHVTGLTLSTEQLDYAKQRHARAGVAGRTDIRLQDYRDVHGSYDAIASIEMFEAVGETYWPDYFDCIRRNLKNGGRACIQTIVISDALFPRYRRGTDFIQQYIFPGGMLPSPSRFRETARRHGLRVAQEFAFGNDYARTLAEWREAFHRALPRVRSLGFDDRFIRTWDFYLAYCEAGFQAGDIDVMQFTLHKP